MSPLQHKRDFTHRYKVKQFSYAVRARDKACFICGGSENLHAHHLNSFATGKAQFDPSNGITLCATCHKNFHVGYMGTWQQPTTREDFYSFVNLLKTLFFVARYIM